RRITVQTAVRLHGVIKIMGLSWTTKINSILLIVQKPFHRHSCESGNLEMKSNGNLSETTETERTGFPLLRRKMMENHHRASNPRGSTSAEEIRDTVAGCGGGCPCR
ncbi:hypothetical protein GC067_08815, partial [Neisseria meningitidis]|nr:hypothetical protein [Neisseria meningitidis]